MLPTVRGILAKTVDYFSAKGVDSPKLSAELLVCHALCMDRIGLYCSLDRPLPEPELALIRPLVRRRAAGEPVALIVGTKEFYGLDFKVDRHTLVPRPETEHLVEEAVEALKPQGLDRAFELADLGTGSGCLAVTLACQLPGARVNAVDISPEALDVARANAQAHGVAERVGFTCGDFSCLPEAGEGYDLVVSNPPYIPEDQYLELSREVRDFEPRGALVGGGDKGLDLPGRAAAAALAALKAGGLFFMEIGFDQGPAACGLLAELGFVDVQLKKDLAGHDRIVCGRAP